MGYASYFEDIQERASNNRVMFGVHDDRLRPKPLYVPSSPPLQPAIAPMTPAVPIAADAITVTVHETLKLSPQLRALSP
jgi:hypothetical protein